MLTLLQILNYFKDRECQIDLIYRMLQDDEVYDLIDYLDDVYGIELTERQVINLATLANDKTKLDMAFNSYKVVV